jgi:hypothetical protein
VDRGRGTPIWTVIIVLTSWGAIRVAQSAYWHRQSNVEAIKYDVANIRAATNSCKNLGNIAVFGNANGARLSNSIFAEPVLFDRTSSSVWTYLKDRKRNSTSLAYTAVVKTPILSANSLADKSSPETIIWRSAAHQYLSSDLTPVTARGSNSRMDIYAYSFWRGGKRNGGLAAAGQYGGSQSGIIATYRLGDTITKPALLLRTSFAPGTEGDREFAIGARVRPFASLPVALSAERRFLDTAKDNFAVYLAGGKSDVRLPANFILNGYAQAGIVRTKSFEHFFDGNLHIDCPLVQNKIASVQIGAALWAGGQKGIARIDSGPSIRSDIKLGHAQFRINADWRFRLAGNAGPGNGPALTVSTGF